MVLSVFIIILYLKKIDINNRLYKYSIDTMAATLKYNLKQITDMSYTGFHFEIPEDTCEIINYLSTQVGSSCISSNVFVKSVPVVSSLTSGGENTNEFMSSSNKTNKKRRGNKTMEVSSDEWESIRTFQTTKIEQKTGIDGDINELRLYLNKLTDKTFLDMREKIIEKINTVCSVLSEQEDVVKLSIMVYDICSTNKFYSKIFADLFAELASMYSWLNETFKQNYTNIMSQYTNIQYVDSDKDYDGFCEMNKNNERRRAITTFYLNLAVNGFIKKEDIVKMLKDILTSIMGMINTPDKKNEVDELTEIVGILFNKEMIDEVDDDADEPEDYHVLDQSILDTISSLAQQKAKDYPSLSNKAIFKYMDLVEM